MNTALERATCILETAWVCSHSEPVGVMYVVVVAIVVVVVVVVTVVMVVVAVMVVVCVMW
jgi:hypothetical protein